MSQKLPEIITEEEFLEIFKATTNPKHKLAFALGFYEAMRISEIVGLRKEISNCCKADVLKIKSKDEFGRQKPQKLVCSQCHKELSYKDIRRSKTEWSIPPLRPENVDRGQKIIRIKSGKGNKDRNIPIAPAVMRGLEKNLPIKLSPRALQIAFKKKAKEVLGKDLHYHSLRHCLEETAEILTPEGWKKYNQIKKGDLVFTYNLKEDNIEEQPILEKYIYDYEGELDYLKSRYIDIGFTEEHNWLVKKRKSAYKINKTTQSYWGDWEYKSWKELNTQFKIMCSGYKKKGLSIGIEKASLLGWILSDGYICFRDKRNKTMSSFDHIRLSQSISANANKVKIIEDILDKCQLKYTKRVEKRVSSFENYKISIMAHFRLMKPSILWIFDWINKDRTPKWKILQLKQDELNAVYEAMMLGDGSRGREYCNQNKKRIDFFRVLSCLTGRRAILGVGELNIGKRKGQPKHRVHISKTIDFQIDKWDILKKNYKGKVWCVSVPNKVFIVRNNETIFFTGNSSASYYLNVKKWNIREVQIFLGHSQLNTTQIYTHINPQQLVDKMWE